MTVGSPGGFLHFCFLRFSGEMPCASSRCFFWASSPERMFSWVSSHAQIAHSTRMGLKSGVFLVVLFLFAMVLGRVVGREGAC